MSESMTDLIVRRARHSFIEGRITQTEYARIVGRARRLEALRHLVVLALMAGVLGLALSPFM